jgi:hypothetical protein
VPCGFELIETKPRDHAAKERFWLAHLTAFRPHPADERLLQDILGVGDGAKHAVGDAHEFRTQRIETRRRVLVRGAGHKSG